jgi:ABC-type nitrate/sulfonate/bicarbonate transport system substrate-binding protein
MKRIISFSFVLILIISLFAACGNSNGTSPANTSTATPPNTNPTSSGSSGADPQTAETLGYRPTLDGEKIIAPTEDGSVSDTQAASLIVINTSSKLECTSTPFVIADQLGFFAKYGLRIEYTGETPPGSTQLPALLSGQNDVLDTHPNQLATWIAEGAEIIGVELNIVDPPEDVDPLLRHMRLFTAKDSSITSLEQLKNYKPGQKITIAGTVPSCATYIANAIFDKAGIGRDRLEFITFYSTAAQLQALEQGQLDLAWVHPPYYKLAATNEYNLIADSFDSGLGPGAGAYLYVFPLDYIDRYPENVQNFVYAVKEAQLWINQNPEEAAKLTGEHIGQDVNATHYYYTGDGIPAKAYLQGWIDDLVSSGTLTAGQVPLEKLVTFQFEKEIS